MVWWVMKNFVKWVFITVGYIAKITLRANSWKMNYFHEQTHKILQSFWTPNLPHKWTRRKWTVFVSELARFFKASIPPIFLTSEFIENELFSRVNSQHFIKLLDLQFFSWMNSQKMNYFHERTHKTSRPLIFLTSELVENELFSRVNSQHFTKLLDL